MLGECLLTGVGVTPNVKAAAAAFRRAAKAGCAVACLELDVMDQRGHGTAQTSEEYFKWVEHAAEANLPPAMIQLA